MGMDMRALYYVGLAPLGDESDGDRAKASENSLNQNFALIAQKLEELEQRLSELE